MSERNTPAAAPALKKRRNPKRKPGASVAVLQQTLRDKNNLTAAVYVDGTEITVLGIFDESKSGQEALAALEAEMDGWADRPRTANWVVADKSVVNMARAAP